jgi:hypothetical protein
MVFFAYSNRLRVDLLQEIFPLLLEMYGMNGNLDGALGYVSAHNRDRRMSALSRIRGRGMLRLFERIFETHLQRGRGLDGTFWREHKIVCMIVW